MSGPDAGAAHTFRRRLAITGIVQGVSYRAWFQQQARGLSLQGWVRNRADGSVEAIVQGPAAAIDAVVRRAWAGPAAARVADVAVFEEPAAALPAGFRTEATA